MKIIVYSTTTCPYCKMLKNYLSTHNLAFEEKMVDVDDAARDEMSALSDGFLGVPFTSITKDNGIVTNVIGFDQKKLDSTLQIGQ